MTIPAAAAGYAIERERGATVVALPSVMQEVLTHIRSAGSLYAAAAARPGAEPFTGRAAAYRFTASHEDWLVRHYRRGGAIARVLTDTYLRAGESRPLRELRASVAARARGVATPDVMAAVTYPSGILYRADLATRFIPDSLDLAAITVASARGGERANARNDGRAAWYAAGALLRTVFQAGIEHVDLNLRNILIAGAPEAPRALLLDLDRARVHQGPLGDTVRRRMLERLQRSRRKIERAEDLEFAPGVLAALEAGLAGERD